MLVVSIEGGIGAGKSSTIRRLAKILRESSLRVDVVEEDVDRWSSSGLLGLLYGNDAVGSTMAFQTLGPTLDFVRRAISI
mmetsp:Transcript_17961/g.61229  ORF Transcript_17961/g.61229 Transcript_17961/m.61229 type:complete len:80 (-) Transcript_17961:20-259(-)